MQHPNEDFSTPSSRQFQSTEVASDHPDTVPVDQDSVVTQMVSGRHSVGEIKQGNAPTVTDDVKHYEQSDHGFASSALFAMSLEDMSNDPELEEAAIRFANRDDVGAEQGLLQALRASGVTTQAGLPWIAALLDLYRATNKPVSFEYAVQEFDVYFDNRTPIWISLSEALATADYRDTEPSAHLNSHSEPLWACPQTLNASALENLRDLLSANPMPWHMDWSKLEVISADALPLLEALFHSLCEEPVALRFSGSSVLLKQLKEMTPANDRSVASTWWHVRLTALRALRLHDEFELAALHYCVTYGAAPVAWQAPQCVFEGLDVNDSDVSTTQAMGITASDVLPLELRGEISGDASQLLTRLDALADDGPIIVSCAALLRVDFAAAGNILNWAAVRQTQGRQVQFREVHRLVAAFFNVIGINEHARVLPRAI
jgi:anti-anti-sigma regulatory factor